MAKIEAPDPSFSGEIGGVKFENGTAETDNQAVIGYCQSAGYKVSGRVLNERNDAPVVADPRDLDDGVVGTRLRDAAVDPRPEDFLAPINAGEANPHGPKVISPEIHASGPAGIRPGVVHVDDHGKQEEREKEFARVRLAEQMPAGEAVKTEVPDLDDHGPLDLSDPGSAEVGRQEAGEESEVEKTEAPKPAKRARASKSAK